MIFGEKGGILHLAIVFKREIEKQRQWKCEKVKTTDGITGKIKPHNRNMKMQNKTKETNKEDQRIITNRQKRIERKKNAKSEKRKTEGQEYWKLDEKL